MSKESRQQHIDEEKKRKDEHFSTLKSNDNNTHQANTHQQQGFVSHQNNNKEKPADNNEALAKSTKEKKNYSLFGQMLANQHQQEEIKAFGGKKFKETISCTQCATCRVSIGQQQLNPVSLLHRNPMVGFSGTDMIPLALPHVKKADVVDIHDVTCSGFAPVLP